MIFTKECHHREMLLNLNNRPSEDDMRWDIENDLELIRQEI